MRSLSCFVSFRIVSFRFVLFRLFFDMRGAESALSAEFIPGEASLRGQEA